MTLIYHPAAVEEYEQAVDFYAEISPELAARFITEIPRSVLSHY